MSETPRLEALALLDAYNCAQGKGQVELRASWWNLNKARRQKGLSSTISAVDVREELVAQIVLSLQSAPDLGEHRQRSIPGSARSAKNNHDDAILTLMDATELIKLSRGGGDGPKPKAAATDTSTGLRQRKAGGNENVSIQEKGDEWTNEHIPDEEEILRGTDPINLFGGLVPRDLRLAQKEAKEALAFYVDAANLAAAIIRVTTK